MLFNVELLLSAASGMGISLNAEMLGRFERYASMLTEWNKNINLTSVTDPDGIALRHFADSLSLLTACEIPEGSSLADVGAGAGFPSLPVLIARPDLKITMLDGTDKKVAFLRAALTELDLKAEAVHMRAEEAGRLPGLRESFDFAAARAVADMRGLSEYCLPLVKPGGRFVAMKGPGYEPDLQAAKEAALLLGGSLESVKPLVLPGGISRTLIIIKKISQTPPKYPRTSAQIAKKPL